MRNKNNTQCGQNSINTKKQGIKKNSKNKERNSSF